MLTVDQVSRALPANLKSNANQALVDLINNVVADPLVADQVRENFLSYTGVLKEGRFKIEDYLSAVTYVSFKLMGKTNEEAYMLTFPARYQGLIAKSTTKKDISSYVSAYNRGKLVNLIMEQSLVPTWVLNQHLYQKALNVQADLMENAASEKVRTDAANSILTHLKKPEASNFQISVDVKDSSGMTELKDAMARMAETQRELIERGISTKQIAAAPLIEGTATEVKN